MTQTTRWLSVIGVGEDGLAGLSPCARTLVDTAEILIGGERHLAMVPPNLEGRAQQRTTWTTPISDSVEGIVAMRGRRVCVLATGDPLQYGIGATLTRSVPAAEMTIIPGISAFALAAARLAWPLDRTALLTLHGRPVETLSLHVCPGAKLLILAHDASTPKAVCAWLIAHGFGESRIVALAHMGGPRESSAVGLARDWSAQVPDFHTLAVECIAGPGAIWHPRTGLPDDAFEHDGKLTKREFRALALAKLKPCPNSLLWDIGAGCGSLGIEWMRAESHASAIALEPKPERRAMAARNAAALGVPGLELRETEAPQALGALPTPDAIFIGGGLSEPTIAECVRALKPGGRLVAHAVTLESESLLLSEYSSRGGDLVRLSVARAEPIGSFSAWRPAMPVTQWAWSKP